MLLEPNGIFSGLALALYEFWNSKSRSIHSDELKYVDCLSKLLFVLDMVGFFF
jgi:hypothetical protein